MDLDDLDELDDLQDIPEKGRDPHHHMEDNRRLAAFQLLPLQSD